ncbi:putative mitochondrial protein [Cucumis melo var. makuwa]|uniref:Mitochondrial protein n=1 Tax=Cucumis melo var. makuwa TaxID=1194695 RepID=A0A5A7UTE5_CUCMM|nr:putative mitochondrial protein [Cucumis melo var. makuwa]
MATPSFQSDLSKTSNPIPESSSNPYVPTSTLFLLSNICNLVPIRLDSTNYVLWKYQVSSILKAHSLFGHIDDTLPCPPKHLPSSTLGTNSEINPKYLQWLSRDQALITLINATLSSSALTHVVGSVTSKALWLSLEKPLVGKLAAASISLKDEEILVHTLNGLSATFNAFHTSIRTRSGNISLEELHTLLILEETTMVKTSAIEAIPTAMAAFHPPQHHGNHGRGCRFLSTVDITSSSFMDTNATCQSLNVSSTVGTRNEINATTINLPDPPPPQNIHAIQTRAKSDVKNAFLHGILQETVYMAQPTSFQDKTCPNHVCLLHKSLYGLKQAPRAWFERFTSYLFTLGFVASTVDPSLFIRSVGSPLTYLLLYVYDIIVTGPNYLYISVLKNQLALEFKISDFGPLKYFLGLEIQSSIDGIFVNQAKYLNDLLHTSRMTSAKSCITLMSTSLDLYTITPPFNDPSLYRRLVGSLQYFTFTHPNIAFSVNRVSQFMHKSTVIHFSAVKRILRYLHGTPTLGIKFRKEQSTVSRSSTEAKYRSLATTTADLYWIRQLLCDLHVPLKTSPTLWCGNVSAISLAHNPVFRARTKHIEIDYHFVREKVLRKDISIRYISSTTNLLIFSQSHFYLLHSFTFETNY